MTNFLWVIVVVCAVDVIGRTLQIGKRELPKKTWAGYALDMVLNWSILTWAIVLLCTK